MSAAPHSREIDSNNVFLRGGGGTGAFVVCRLKIASIALDVACDEVLHSVDMSEEITRSKISLANMSQSLSQQESVWEVGTLITSTQFQSEVRDARIGIEKIISQVGSCCLVQVSDLIPVI